MRALLTCLMLSLALPAWAQTARPQIETRKVDGADGVYIFRNGGHQSMFVVTPDGVIATDPIAYGRPTGGEDYVKAIRAVTDKPIKYLIYSHIHYDHIAGGQAFKDAGATVVAHERTKERMQQAPMPNTPLPDETVGDSGRVLRLGGKVLELSYVGRNHSDNLLVMRLPQERLLFVVDLIPVGQFPGLGMIDFYPGEAIESLKKILAMDWDRMIPAHPGAPGDRLGTKKDVEDQIALQEHVSEAVKEQARAGKCWNPAEAELQFDRYKDMPNYANGRTYTVRRYCGFWGRGS